MKKPKHIYIQLYITGLGGWELPLTRKARVVGSSLVLTIPSQLAKAYDINDGEINYQGKDLFEYSTEERALTGIFLLES